MRSIFGPKRNLILGFGKISAEILGGAKTVIIVTTDLSHTLPVKKLVKYLSLRSLKKLQTYLEDAPIAQLDRAFASGAKGQGFESLWARRIRTKAGIRAYLVLAFDLFRESKIIRNPFPATFFPKPF